MVATIAIPESGGARAICLDVRARATCPKSEAVFVGYRGRGGEEYWNGPTTLLITQEGGEVWKQPPRRPVEVGGVRVEVQLDYTP